MTRSLTNAVPALLLMVTPLPTEALPGLQDWPEIFSVAGQRQIEVTGLLATPARLDVEDVPLARALLQLQKRSGVPVAYSPTLLPADRLVTCRCTEVTVGEAMSVLLRGTTFEFAVVADQVVIRRRSALRVQPPLLEPAPGLGRLVRTAADVPVHFEPPAARAVGTVTGLVEDARTGQPVAGVQVYFPGLDLGALTPQNGRYLLANVPAGTHTLTAERVGYRTMRQEVTVRDGETVVQNFLIAEEALQLDEVIVTGTPGGTQRRAIGNAVSRIEAEEITTARPIQDMQQLLTARVPGLDFARQTGNIGTGSHIRIRGISSFELGSQPLIYIDGVRMDNSADLGPDLPSLSYSSATSALDDLSPNDIASIEVIKGPAAATLYGTEASAGVIQIITKKGQTGEPQFDLTMRQGTNFMMDPAGVIGDQYAKDLTTGEIYRFNIYEEETAKGFEPFQYGQTQEYSLSVRGGTEAVTYYVSAGWNDQEGIVDYNWSERFSTRANLGVLMGEDVQLDVSLGYVTGETSYASGTQGTGGLWPALMWAQGNLLDTPRRGFLQNTPEDFATIEATRDYVRFTGSATLTHNPLDWLSHRIIVGIDRGDEENQVLFPRHPDGAAGPFRNQSLGEVTLERPINTELTLDYSISGRYALNDAIAFTSSAGLQYYSKELNRVESIGRIFPSPVIRSIEGATGSSTGQTFLQNKSLGVFVQQEMSLNDRVFLTAAIRADDNSAFGANFDAALYPKVSGTWVVSEEDFWSVDLVNSLRLRLAWGRAGRQPGTFAAVTLFRPAVGPGGAPAVTPATLGNPEIGPEVSSELELGFDAALFDQRISAEFTYFTQKVKDALTDVPLSPTGGFPGTQDANLGRLDNWGWEFSVNARAVERENWALDLGVSGSHSMNQIVDLGGRQPTSSFREGFPYPAVVSDIIVSAELDEFGQPINVMCDAGAGYMGLEPGGEAVPCDQTEDYALLLGTPYPQYAWSFDATLTLFQNLQIFGLVDGEFGRWGRDYNINCRHTACFYNSEPSLRLNDPIFVESSLYSDRHPSDIRYQDQFDAAFLKLREVGVRYQLPDTWVARVGAERASISLAGRDLWYLWRAQEQVSGVNIPSPELTDPNTSSNFSLFQWPGFTSLSASLRVSF